MIKKSLITIFNFVIVLQNKIKRWKIDANPSIDLNKNARIKNTSIIELIHGGKITIGNSEILDNVIIQSYGGEIRIGDGCSVNANTIIYGHGNVEIGNNVLIAGGCMIIPANHIFANPNLTISSQGLSLNEIIIEDDVWIGHGCSILSGVRIGTGSVIAAGSVVNKNVDVFSIYAGVPAKKIKNRNI